MVPGDKGHASRIWGASLLFGLHLGAVACPHLLRALLSAKRAIISREKASAVGAFIQIGAIKLFRIVSSKQFSHIIPPKISN